LPIALVVTSTTPDNGAVIGEAATRGDRVGRVEDWGLSVGRIGRNCLVGCGRPSANAARL